MKPNALSAERRPPLLKPAPNDVRRGGCESSALVAGCGVVSVLDEEVWLAEEPEEPKKNCGSRNELLRCGCDAG